VNKFVLIGGMPRSGTTLLETVVGSHSRIAIPPGDYPFAEQATRGLSVERIFSVLEKKKTWQLWLEKGFADLYGAPHGEAFVESMRRYASSADKDIPAAKAPYSEFFYETYGNWLQSWDLRFVHVIRNPIDVVASLKKSHIHTNWNVYVDTLEVQTRNWLRSTSIGMAHALRNPAGYRIVRYEDFVDDPSRETDDLCQFLGVEQDTRRMLDRVDYSYHETNTSFPDEVSDEQKDARRIFQRKSRRSYLEQDEIDLVCRICGETALAMGFEDDNFSQQSPLVPGKLKTSERWRRRVGRFRKRLGGRKSVK
jgi:hypothetical protein